MKHHFGDMLDRTGAYWTLVPNRERYRYRIGEVPAGSPEITIATIGKADEDWAHVLSLPNLEELTLHEPTPAQLQAIGELRSVKRLRITHARPKSLEFLRTMEAVEELVLEYISGFSDLAPLQSLKRLRALHLENLRRVSDFGGLAGAVNLQYLAIHGTLDWKQPIDGFEFLRGLPRLEVLALWQVLCRAPYPAFLPILALQNLKRLRVHGSYLPIEECAFLEEALPGVEGASWGPFQTWTYARLELPNDDVRSHLPEEVLRANHPDVRIERDGKRTIGDPASSWFEATGKGGGRVKCSSPNAPAKCREYADRYEALKRQARAVIDAARKAPRGES